MRKSKRTPDSPKTDREELWQRVGNVLANREDWAVRTPDPILQKDDTRRMKPEGPHWPLALADAMPGKVTPREAAAPATRGLHQKRRAVHRARPPDRLRPSGDLTTL
jgi:hypothetical protein